MISNLTLSTGFQASDLGRVVHASRTQCAWTDGTPTASGSTKAALRMYTSNGNWMELTAPVGTETRTFMIWLGGAECLPTVRATLSDGSIAFAETTIGNLTGLFHSRIAVTCRALSPGQTIAVRMTMAEKTGNGYLLMQAAALRPGGAT